MIDPNARKTEASELLRRLELKALFLDQEILENWSTAIAFKNSSPSCLVNCTPKKETSESAAIKKRNVSCINPNVSGLSERI